MIGFAPLTEMFDILSRPLLQALINGLWQGMAVFGLVWLALRMSGRLSATTRHAVWLMSLLLIGFLPLLDLTAGERRVVVEPATSGNVETISGGDEAVRSGGFSSKLSERIAERRSISNRGRSRGKADSYLSQELSQPARRVTMAESARAIPRDSLSGAPAITVSDTERAGDVRGAWVIEGLGGRIPALFILLWLTVSLLMSMRIARSYLAIHRLRRSFVRASKGDSNRVADLAEAMGIGRRVNLFFSDEVPMPMTIGTLWPLIVLPKELAESLSHAEFDSIMAHELAHIKRFDYLTNLLQRLVQAGLFFHPAVWLIGRYLSIERELACDDWAVKTCEPRRYASCLTKLVELLRESKPLAAATGILFGKHVITWRVEMILNRNRNANTSVSKPALAYAVGLAAAVAFVFSSITPAIAVPVGRNGGEKLQAGVEANWTVKAMIMAGLTGQKPAPPAPPAPPAEPAKPVKEAPPPPSPAPPAPPALPDDPEASLTLAVIPGLDPSSDWMPEDDLVASIAPVVAAQAPLRFFDSSNPAAYSGLSALVSTPQVAQASRARAEAELARTQRGDDRTPPAIPEAELLGVLTEIVKKDADPTVRHEALQGIYRMRSDAAINTMIQLYDETSDPKVKGEILGYLVRRNGDNSKAVSKLMSIARNEKDETLRNKAIRSLGYVKGDEGATNLIQIYDSLQDSKQKQTLIRYLSINKSRKAVDKLIQIAKSDTDPEVRQSAVRGLYGIDNRLYLEMRERVAPRIGRLENFEGLKGLRELEGLGGNLFDAEKFKDLQDRMKIEIPEMQLDMELLQDEMLEKIEPELRRLQEMDELRGRPRLRIAPRSGTTPTPTPVPKKEKTSSVI